MSSIEARLRALERQGGGRCYNCRDWQGAYWDETGTHPGTCGCGYTPVLLRIVYDDALPPAYSSRGDDNEGNEGNSARGNS